MVRLLRVVCVLRGAFIKSGVCVKIGVFIKSGGVFVKIDWCVYY